MTRKLANARPSRRGRSSTRRFSGREPGNYNQRTERGFATHDDALAWWLAQKNNQHRPVAKAEVIKAAPLTLAQFSKRWLASIANTITPGAHATYGMHVEHWIVPSLGDALLVDLEREPERIEAAQAKWLTAPRRDGRKGCVSPGYVRSVRTTLQTILNRAKKLRLIVVNPCEFVGSGARAA